MCQWHMFSTDRSGAEKWECVARNNPQASKSGVFDPDIVIIQLIKYGNKIYFDRDSAR